MSPHDALRALGYTPWPTPEGGTVWRRGEPPAWLREAVMQLRASSQRPLPPGAVAALADAVAARLQGGACAPEAASALGPVVDVLPVDSGPVTSWAAVARVVGVSLDTVSRRRKAWGIEGAPYFESADAARKWWKRQTVGDRLDPRPAPTKKRAAPHTATGTGGTTLDDLLSPEKRR